MPPSSGTGSPCSGPSSAGSRSSRTASGSSERCTDPTIRVASTRRTPYAARSMERTQAIAAVFEPVHALSTFEETVERLGTAIRLGLLGAGERLPPERELSDLLGISRSTLRQAITTLVQSGHLISLRGRSGGTFVTASPPLADRPPPALAGE